MKAKIVRYIRVTILCNLVMILAFAVPSITYADTQPIDTDPLVSTPDPSTPPTSDTQDPSTSPTTDPTATPSTPDTDTSDSTMPAIGTTPSTTPTVSPNVVPSTTTPTSNMSTTDTTGVQNNVDGTAQTGDATVAQNTTAGNATSGDATDQATIINAINSTLSSNPDPTTATFVSNVSGDVNGNIDLTPEIMDALNRQTTEAVNSSGPASLNLAVNTGITNNVNLSATSGSASVLNNTTAGNATTGNANAVANVVNIMNSVIGANKSFVGVINIYGNLDGNILVAPDFISQLLASNSPSITGADTLSDTTINNAQTVLNNLNLSAQSGNASVTNNTTAGNATSGDAATNIDILNLTGEQVLASNSLLVFVNVLGKWVGLIINAPTGSTAAAFDGGSDAQNTILPDVIANDTNSTQLTNNITLAAKSGDATVAQNTTAGNATTGNATASANIANISQTVFGLTGWFGILFINVFGSWLGSFGISAPTQTPSDPPVGLIASAIITDPGTGSGPLSHPHKAFIAVTPSGSLTSVPVVVGGSTPSDPPTTLGVAASLRPVAVNGPNDQALFAIIILGSFIVGYGALRGSWFGTRKAFR